jgi:glutathione S-transferase
MKLIIGNKCYSSWSFRPWIAMTACGIAFDEEVVPLDTPAFAARMAELDAAGRVPLLIDGDVKVWDSLAIIEYVAERHPHAGVWPSDPAKRAVARSVSAEMHSGFNGVRGACPMNFGKRFARRDRGADIAQDVARISRIWADAEGPFLFGAFCAADAMYAPVVSRFVTYDIEVPPEAARYMDAVRGHAAYQAWEAAGLAETWIVDADEIDEPAVVDLRRRGA